MPPETPSLAAETIGQRLKRLRLERTLSQRELAAPGVSYAYISRIEAGTRQPSVKALRKLAAKLGVSADYLETGSELDPAATRELRLSDLELAVRLGEREGVEEGLGDVLAAAGAAADAPTAFRARVALAAMREDAGEVGAAIALLEAAVAEEVARPAEHVDVYSQLGRAYVRAGRVAQAVELFERCIERSGDNPAAETRYAVLLSYALVDSGDLAKAGDVVGHALAQMGDTEDPYMRVRLYWSISRLADAEGRHAVALANIRKAIALLELTEDALNLGRAHLVAARLSLERGNPKDSTDHLDRAERLFGVTPSVPDLVELTIQRARTAHAGGEAPAAIAFARAALALESQPADRGFALFALADGLTLNGETDEAGACFAEAVDVLESTGRWRPAANACRSWAHMLRHSGRDTEALDVLDRAAELGMRAAPQRTHADR